MSAVVHAEYVPFGRTALVALARAIRHLEGDDPLAPVTVVVPSNLAGLTARRLLAAGIDDDRAGLINVAFATPYQLAAQLGGPRMARDGRLPLTSPVLHAAVRAALRSHTGSFVPVARHVATELAVARVYGELSRATPETLEALRASDRSRTRDLLAIVDDTRVRLEHYHDEDDLVAAARARLHDDPEAGSPLGSLVVHLVDELSPSLTGLLQTLVTARPARLVVGLTGEAQADAGARAVAAALAPNASGSVERELVSPTTRLIEAADPDKEVRTVIRSVAAAIDRGRPLDRIAVLYPVAEPYLRTLHDQLDAAGIAHNGPAGRPLADSVVGRLVARLLDQVVAGGEDPRHLLRRQGLIDIVSAAPLREGDGRTLPATAFDLISRRAGVIGGAGDWQEKLERHQRNLHERRILQERDGASAGRLALLDREQGETQALARFVADLAHHLDPAGVPASWRDRSRWLIDLLSQLLPPEGRRQRWPADEAAAADAVIEVVERVAVLDQFDPDATFGAFSRTVHSELEATRRRRGRFGQGVLVAPLVATVGLDVDSVFVLGCSEGTLPPPRREDSLLPDDERRRAVLDELPLRRARTDIDRRDFLAALRIGMDEVVLVHGAGDHRTGKARLPSRWLLEIAGEIVNGGDAPLLSTDWPDEVHHLHPLHRHLVKMRSFHEGVHRSPAPSALLDRDLAQLVAYADSGQPFDAHHLFADDPVLTRGLDLTRARSSPAFTRFDGNLGGAMGDSATVDGVLSATRLETWASCPMRYFLANELGLAEVERPEEIIELSALDRGSLIHVILEDFLSPVVEAEPASRPRPAQPWGTDDRDRLLTIAEKRFAEFEQRGLTGKPLLWRVHREHLLADLDQWLVADTELRRELDTVPEAVEMRIGVEGQPPVVITLSDGRQLRFRGYADRVDRRAADGTPVVLDYKTGKTSLRPAHLEADPVYGGTRLQLGLYAEAARQRFEHDDAAAFYWYTSARGEFRRLGYQFTPEREQRFREVVTSIVDGIEAGVFVTNSGDYNAYWASFDNCTWCDFDDLCPRDRNVQSVLKQQDPAAGQFTQLVMPEDDGA
ncbi:MAG: PD-(D/E)XK nuclease family protein [Acidimicrobiales bacterium]